VMTSPMMKLLAEGSCRNPSSRPSHAERRASRDPVGFFHLSGFRILPSSVGLSGMTKCEAVEWEERVRSGRGRCKRGECRISNKEYRILKTFVSFLPLFVFSPFRAFVIFLFLRHSVFSALQAKGGRTRDRPARHCRRYGQAGGVRGKSQPP
jgi:hypothetical protein